MHDLPGLPIPGIVHADAPYAWTAGRDNADAKYGVEAADRVEAKILEVGAENVAAFIGEPVMGAGGVITRRRDIGRVCRRFVANTISC